MVVLSHARAELYDPFSFLQVWSETSFRCNLPKRTELALQLSPSRNLDKQGITGLGMEAQREAVRRYVQQRIFAVVCFGKLAWHPRARCGKIRNHNAHVTLLAGGGQQIRKCPGCNVGNSTVADLLGVQVTT